MNLLIIDSTGMSLDLALRSMAAGHKVKCFIRNNKDGSHCDVGTGMITRVPTWEPHMEWADLIFLTDNNMYLPQLEKYREKGYPILGCNIEGAKWEQDREKGTAILKMGDIEVIPMEKFTDYGKAIQHVIKNPMRYCCKPIGDGDKALSYVAKSAADMVYMLQKWEKAKAHKGAFILQDFCKGMEFGVGAWFGPGGFNEQLCESWEFKKLMNDDLGVATGEQGTIVRYTNASLLHDTVLGPLEGMLYAIGYTGYVDVNCIVLPDGRPMPLEFTMRPGWPLFQIQQALHKGDPIEWMVDLIDGKDTLKTSKDIACGVVISIPEYPYDNVPKKENSGYPLFGIKEEDLVKNVHASEVQWGKAPDMDGDQVKMNVPMYVTAGEYICTVTGTGKTVEKARDACYKLVKDKINVPNSIMYRTDIGCKLEKELPDLHKLGYCKDVDYA